MSNILFQKNDDNNDNRLQDDINKEDSFAKVSGQHVSTMQPIQSGQSVQTVQPVQTAQIESNKSDIVNAQETSVANNYDENASNNESPLVAEVGTASSISSDEFSNLDLELRKLIEYYEEIAEFRKGDIVSPMHVDELASKFAGLYEQVRRVIDWKEEHLIRRTAIERSLKRRLLSKLGSGIDNSLNGRRIAEPLITEIIRGGYFANDSISRAKIPLVEKVLDKYIFILGNSSAVQKASPLEIKKKVQFYTWVLEVAACEVEELLDPPLKEQGLINYMTNIIVSRVNVSPEGSITAEQKVLQTYIAVHRTLFNLDDPVIAYHLIKFKYPSWVENDPQLINEFAHNLIAVWQDLEDQLSSKAGIEFYKLCDRYDAVFRVLGFVLDKIEEDEKSRLEVFSDWKQLKEYVKKCYEERMKTLKSRLMKSAIFSTLSIFLAGGISLFIVEVPLAKLFLGEFSFFAIFVDLLIPTLLMLVLVSLIRPADKDNLPRLIAEVKKLVYSDTSTDIYSIHLNKKIKFLKNLFFGFVYFIVTIISFGLVFWIFKLANVPWTSLYIDTANVAVVVFAALVIKQRSKELAVKENTGFGDFLVEIFSIPLARLGQWLSAKWKEYNFVSVFFMVAIDLPILSVVEIIEDWRNYLKDKGADIH